MSTGSLPVCRATKDAQRRVSPAAAFSAVIAAIVAFGTAGPPAAMAHPPSPITISC